MAKGSRKKRRPTSGGGAKNKKSAPISKEAEDDPAPPSVPSTTSAQGDRKRPGDGSEVIRAASAASRKTAPDCEADGSTGISAVSLGKYADGMPAAAAAAADDDDIAVRGEGVRASAEGEGSRELASPSPGGGVESAAVPESGAASTAAAAAAAAGLGHEIVPEEKLDAPTCSEPDGLIAVDGGGSALEGKAAPLQPQEDGDAQGETGSSVPENEQSLLAPAASAAAAVALVAAVADGGRDGAGKAPDHVSTSSLQRSDGEGISTGTEVEERSESLEVASDTPTARATAEEARVEEVEKSSEPQSGAEAAAPKSATAPPLETGAATSIAVREMPAGFVSDVTPQRAQAEAAPSAALPIPGLDEGVEGSAPDRPDVQAKENPPPTEAARAGTAGGAIVETPAASAATTVSISPPSEPSGGAATADSARRGGVDGVEEPQPPPPAASTGNCAAAADGAVGTRPASSDASKESVAVGGVVDCEQNLTVAEVLPGPAPASADGVTEGMTAVAKSGGSARQKAEAAKAAAEAATVAAVLASADAASAAEAAAVAVVDAEAALEAIEKAEASARLSTAEPDGAEATARQTAAAAAAAAAAAGEEEECVAADTAATDEAGAGARERTVAHAAASAAAAAAAGPAASSAAAFPPLFLEPKETGLELNAAAPTGATILTGSVGADIFSSRSAGGACPWPGSSDDEDGDDDGFGGSSRSRMSVEEAAAFMSLGGTGHGSTGRGGGGGAFASGSSWATTGTSVIDTTVPAEDRPGPAADAAAGGGAPPGGFSSVGSGGGTGRLALGGNPLAAPFVGPDDFLSVASVGGMGGLSRRRFSADAVAPTSSYSGGGGTKGSYDLAARRSTVSETVGRGGEGSSAASVLAGGAVVRGLETPAVVEGVALGGSTDGDTDTGGRLGSSPSTKGEAVDETPAAAEEAPPALLVRKDGEGGGGETAVVEAAAAAGHGESTSGRADAVVKHSIGGGGFADCDSAATSCAGGEGGAGSPSPSRGNGAEAAALGPGVNASTGGCCVVS